MDIRDIVDTLLREEWSDKDVPALGEKIAQRFELPQFLLGVRYPLPAPSPQDIILSNYPQEWFSRYRQEADPVLRHAETSILPVTWRGVERSFQHDPGRNLLLREARDFGMNAGLVVPLRSARRSVQGLFCLCGDTHPRHVDHRAWELLPALQMVSAYLFEGVIDRCGGRPAPPRLTPREQEVLQWAAVGKDNDMIARLMRISQATVKAHLRHAFDKIGAPNRTAAAVSAVHLGLIDPY